jgi:hypothetical protein
MLAVLAHVLMQCGENLIDLLLDQRRTNRDTITERGQHHLPHPSARQEQYMIKHHSSINLEETGLAACALLPSKPDGPPSSEARRCLE